MLPTKLIQALITASGKVSYRRKKNGPLCPEWSWLFETGTEILRDITNQAFEIKDLHAQREFFDRYHFTSPALLKVWIEPTDFEHVAGRWISPKIGHTHQRVILYLHGGGYVFYSKFHDNLMSWISHYTRTRLFALDYPLAPEHPFPAAIDYALKTYQSFLDRYADANNIILMGDSAGGGLVLSLLQKIREKGLEMPEKAVLLSPWVDLSHISPVTLQEHPYDWIDGRMGQTWAQYYAKGLDLKNPLLSPLYMEMKDLPELYIQYGSKEFIQPQIESFVTKAIQSGVNLTYDCFSGMNHDFQFFGDYVPQSSQALQKISNFLERVSASSPLSPKRLDAQP